MKNFKIAVFGSAFNPPHRGHEDVINQALANFDQVWLIPNYKHAFGKAMLPYDLRLEMAQTLAAETLRPSGVIVSDIERDMALEFSACSSSKHILPEQDKAHPIYTYDVLCALEARVPDAQLHFVIGPDNANPDVWQRFYKAHEITQRWALWIAKERIGVRSTRVREAMAEGILPSVEQCNKRVVDLLARHRAQLKNADI